MMSSMLELARKMLAGEAPLAPIMQLIGITPKLVEPGHAVFEMEAGDRHHNPLGTLHGGVYTDLADVAMGMAFAATLGAEETFTTVELKINFLRGVRQGRLTAEARVVKAGRSIAYVECDVSDDQQRLVARASSTCLRLRREAKVNSP
jgi:uncharacterized protein (TIGR00369 family)